MPSLVRSRVRVALGVGAVASLGFLTASHAWVRGVFPAPPTASVPVVEVAGGKLKIEICADNVVRVVFARDLGSFERPTLATAVKRCVDTPYTVTRATGVLTVATAKLTVRVDTATGAITFLDSSGQTILAETAGGGRTLTPAVVQGERVFQVRQQWQPQTGESLYGLGQHQHGLLDIKDTDLELRQYNTEVAIPFLVSSRGYGILWDNTSFTRFGDLGPAVPLPGTTGLYKTGGEPGDVEAHSGSVSWSGSVTPAVTGDHTFRTYSSGEAKLEVGGQVVIDHWRQGWLPNEDVAHVQLTAGKPVPVRLQWRSDIGVKIIRLLWKPPVANRTTSLWSEVGDGVDYHFVYGPQLDDVVAGYRRLTGQAPMMPIWAFGFWQCRERYSTAAQVLDVLKGYRDRGAPIDNIVQDWRYWPEGTWGSHLFDPARFPDPAGWLKTIHDTYHARLMISVWPKFYPGTATFEALAAAGFLYQPNLTEKKKDFLGQVFTYYDAFNPRARALYWSQINAALGSRGVDAWWMDASEPEVVEGPFPSIAAQVATNQSHMHPTAAGTAARVLNAYSLVNSQAIWDGQRAAAPDKRVVILTRSGFAGQQRYGAATWSGDISSTWTALRKQIPAGLSFSLSGIPYWTVDSGGFSVPPRFARAHVGSNDQAEWRELNTRWFEYATFLPIMRVHGQTPHREIWEFGGDASPYGQAMLKFDRLRYRLLPYVYSLAGAVTHGAGTMLRPLVMDFRGDPRARGIVDQYMFGPALLVAPITANGARSRAVYLPPSAVWYDFWTGARAAATGPVTANAPLDAIPVFVRGGSIVPTGPERQYTTEKPSDPITLQVYPGADGAFSLYEDDGTTNAYERGAFATIPLRWTNASRTLTIDARKGNFSGMLKSRTFRVMLVGAARPTQKQVRYDGTKVELAL